MELRGVSVVTAAGLIGHVKAMTNYRNGAAFAAKCRAAPVPCSSGRRVAVRPDTGGDRQLNRLLHVIAMAQVVAADHPGRCTTTANVPRARRIPPRCGASSDSSRPSSTTVCGRSNNVNERAYSLDV